MYLRNRTLERVTRSIIEHQRQFFYDESGVLEPSYYSTIAAELQWNESTISRAVKTKGTRQPFGVMCLKDFFTSTAGKDIKNYDAVSRQMVERHLREMIEQEDKHNPLATRTSWPILKEARHQRVAPRHRQISPRTRRIE
jgi:RNA polymerase sigma-54 factor